QEVGHDRAMPDRVLEGVGAQRLATQGAVDVGDDEEHELDVLGGAIPDRARGRLHLDHDATSPSVAARRSTIMSSSSSVAVKAGAKTTSSPTNPSRFECVVLMSRPWRRATSSTRSSMCA